MAVYQVYRIAAFGSFYSSSGDAEPVGGSLLAMRTVQPLHLLSALHPVASTLPSTVS